MAKDAHCLGPRRTAEACATSNGRADHAAWTAALGRRVPAEYFAIELWPPSSQLERRIADYEWRIALLTLLSMAIGITGSSPRPRCTRMSHAGLLSGERVCGGKPAAQLVGNVSGCGDADAM